MNHRVSSHDVIKNRTIARFRPVIFALWSLASGQFAVGVEAPAVAPAQNETLPLSGFAAIGSSFAQSSRLNELGWTEEQITAFVEGVRAALHGKAYAFDQAARQVSGEMGRRVH